MADNSGQGSTSATNPPATAPAQDWMSMFSCCMNSVSRKAGPVASVFQSSASAVRKRVLVLGKSEIGKSRTLSILQHPDTPVDSTREYPATNGTATVQVDIAPMSYTFIEVGGALVEFWSRSIDSRIDGIWYLIDKEDYDKSEYATLERFLSDSRDVLLKRKPALVITVLGVDESASTSEIEILVNASGAIDPKKMDVVPLADPTDYASILKSIDALKSKLIQIPTIPIFIGGAGHLIFQAAAPHPRSILVDTDSRSADSRAYACHCKDVITYGKFHDKDEYNILQDVVRTLRQLMSRSDKYILLIHAVGGGTGSGWSIMLAGLIKEKFPGIKIVSVCILPGEVQIRPFEKYNTAKWTKGIDGVFSTIFHATRMVDVSGFWDLMVDDPTRLDLFQELVYSIRGYLDRAELDRSLKRIVTGVVFHPGRRDMFRSVHPGLKFVSAKISSNVLVIESGMFEWARNG